MRPSAVNPQLVARARVPDTRYQAAMIADIGNSISKGINNYQANSLKKELLGQASEAVAQEPQEPKTLEQRQAEIQQGQIDLAEEQEVGKIQQQAGEKREQLQRQRTMQDIINNPESSQKLLDLQQRDPAMAKGVVDILLSRDQARIADLQQEATLANRFHVSLAQGAADPSIADDDVKSMFRARFQYLQSKGVPTDKLVAISGKSRDEIVSWARTQAAISKGSYESAKAGESVVIGNVDPEQYTPESLQEFSSTRDYSKLKRVEESADIGGDFTDPSPKDFTIDSISKYQKTGEASDLVRYHSETAKRGQRVIVQGITAAQGIPTIKRSIALLDEISTGGYASVALKVKQAFGVEGADEAELSANLGRSVLSQLKDIFGSQFTDKEGLRLEKIEARFGKSVAGNRRLLNQLLKMSDLKVKQARVRAVAEGDDATVAEIDEYMNFEFDGSDFAGGGNQSNGLPDGVTEDDITTTMEENNMTREQVLERLQNGS